MKGKNSIRTVANLARIHVDPYILFFILFFQVFLSMIFRKQTIAFSFVVKVEQNYAM